MYLFRVSYPTIGQCHVCGKYAILETVGYVNLSKGGVMQWVARLTCNRSVT